jgi:hypothetical protein
VRQPGWLDRESTSWLRDGLITADQRRAILARYRGRAERNVADTLTWLAALAGGVGLVLLVGWNWDQLPRSAQMGVSFGGTAVLFGAALVAASRGRRALAGRLTFLASVVAASMFVSVDDAYHLGEPGVSMWWAVTACLAAALVPGTVMVLLASGVTAAWLIVQGGGPPPWPFLALAPLLALAVEQAPDRIGAGAVTGVIVLWAWSVANDTWWSAFTTSLVVALLAASALDAWAHAPEARRPAFARATPAAFFLFLTLLLLQLVHEQVLSHARDDATASLWPALAVAGALALVAVSALVGRRPGGWRTAGLAVLCAAWLGAWVMYPILITAPTARWAWAAAFGLAAVLTGVSLVRQAARDQDLGLFVMGVLNVIGFVAARAIDADGNLWQSALALFAGAVILGWLARTWAASRREAAPR